MGLFDEIKKLTQPFEDEDEFFDDEDLSARTPVGEEPPAPQKKTSFFSESRESSGENAAPIRPSFGRREPRDSRVVDIAQPQQKLTLVKPERFEEASEIADHLREKHTVVINLESTNKDVARRLLDFLSGVTYAQEGVIKKIASSTYLIAPYNVDLTTDGSDDIENNGVYF